MIKKNWKKFFVLREGPIDGINDSTGAAKKYILLNLVKHIQNFDQVCITMMMKVT